MSRRARSAADHSSVMFCEAGTSPLCAGRVAWAEGAGCFGADWLVPAVLPVRRRTCGEWLHSQLAVLHDAPKG